LYDSNKERTIFHIKPNGETEWKNYYYY
jgi:hypothetical protein